MIWTKFIEFIIVNFRSFWSISSCFVSERSSQNIGAGLWTVAGRKLFPVVPWIDASLQQSCATRSYFSRLRNCFHISKSFLWKWKFSLKHKSFPYRSCRSKTWIFQASNLGITISIWITRPALTILPFTNNISSLKWI